MDGGFARQYPCPQGVSYCLTVAAVPPIDWADLAAQLLRPESLAALGGATAETLAGGPARFVSNVLLPLRGLNVSAREGVAGAVSYLRGASPPSEVSIWPGERAAEYADGEGGVGRE
jgi:hypothetical protein